MTEFFMVRHGESEHNTREIIQGQIDSELTERGREQAERLGEYLENLEFDIIYTSDLKRARETVETAIPWREYRSTEKLRERSYGELEGEHSTSWEELDPEDHHEWKVEGGESLSEHKERVADLLNKVVEKDHERVLLVAHGGTVIAALAHILNYRSRQDWRIMIDNCSLTRIKYEEEDGWFVGQVNDTCHLE